MSLIQISVPTVASPILLTSCVGSIMEQDGVVPGDLLIICNSERVLEESQMWQSRGCRVHYALKNLGTCASWNLACRKAWDWGYDACLLLNDDVILRDLGAIRKMAAAVDELQRCLYTIQELGFSGICITREVWREVGEFDEGFWPAYFEDNDYHRRVHLARIQCVDMPIAADHRGSASLREWREWEKWNAQFAFPVNARRYLEKWGGRPETPTFDKPWDGHPENSWSTRDILRVTAPPPPWGWN